MDVSVNSECFGEEKSIFLLNLMASSIHHCTTPKVLLGRINMEPKFLLFAIRVAFTSIKITFQKHCSYSTRVLQDSIVPMNSNKSFIMTSPGVFHLMLQSLISLFYCFSCLLSFMLLNFLLMLTLFIDVIDLLSLMIIPKFVITVYKYSVV